MPDHERGSFIRSIDLVAVAYENAISAYHTARHLNYAFGGDDEHDPMFLNEHQCIDLASLIFKIRDRATPEVLAQQLVILKYRKTPELTAAEQIALKVFVSTGLELSDYLSRLVAAQEKAREEAARQAPAPTPIDETTLERTDDMFDTF